MVFEAKLIRLDKSGKIIKEYIINKKEFTFGKFPHCDVSINDSRVERVHCRLVIDAWDRVNIINYSNEYPTKINDVPIEVKRPLLHKHVLDVLENKFIFECKRNDAESGFATPQKSTIADQAPSSCPDLRFCHRIPRRFTVHSFFHSTSTSDDIEKKDTNNENISKMNSLAGVKDLEKEKTCNISNVSDSIRSLPGLSSNNEIPKIMIIDSTPDKKCGTLKQNINLEYSDVKITSYSPRIAGVQIEKSFADFVSCTPKSTYSTPKGVMPKVYESNQSLKYVTPNTSKKRYLQEAPNSPMYLLDFTTPTKFAPKSPNPNLLLKSCTKKEMPKWEMPSCSKTFSTPVHQKNETFDTPISVESSAASIIEIDDDSVAGIKSVSKTPTKRFSAKLATPKRSSPSLMKRILLKSTQKAKPDSTLLGSPTTPKLQKMNTPRRLAQNSRQYQVMTSNSLSLISEKLQETTPRILQKFSETTKFGNALENKNDPNIDNDNDASKTAVDSNIISENFGEAVETSVKGLYKTFYMSAKDHIMTETKVKNDEENGICLNQESKFSNKKREFLPDEECFNATQELQVLTSNKRRIERRVSMPAELVSKPAIQFRRSSLKSENLNNSKKCELKHQFIEESMGAIVEENSYIEETIIVDDVSPATVKNSNNDVKSENSNISELNKQRLFDKKQNENIYAVVDESEYNYGKEVLKSEDDITELEFEGLQDLLATPRTSSTPITKFNKKTDEAYQFLLHSPSLEVFNSSRSKNLMMTATPSGAITKQSFASKEFLNCTEFTPVNKSKIVAIEPSPFSATDILTDLPAIEVQDWIKKIEVQHLDEDLIDDKGKYEKENVSLKSSIEQNLTSDPLHLSVNKSSNAIEHTETIRDPLSLSMTEEQNSDLLTLDERSMTPIESEISGIHLLDESEDSFSLKVSDTESVYNNIGETDFPIAQNSEINKKEELKSNETFEPLVLSDTDSNFSDTGECLDLKKSNCDSSAVSEVLTGKSDTEKDLKSSNISGVIPDTKNSEQLGIRHESNDISSSVYEGDLNEDFNDSTTKDDENTKHILREINIDEIDQSISTDIITVNNMKKTDASCSQSAELFKSLHKVENELLKSVVTASVSNFEVEHAKSERTAHFTNESSTSVNLPFNVKDDIKSSLKLQANTSSTSLFELNVTVKSNIQSEDPTFDDLVSNDASVSQYLDNSNQMSSNVEADKSGNNLTLNVSEFKDKSALEKVFDPLKAFESKYNKSTLQGEDASNMSVCVKSTSKSQDNNKMSSKLVLKEALESNIEKNAVILDASESNDENDIQSQAKTENPTESNIEKMDMGIWDVFESNEENNIQSLEDKDPVKLDVDESDDSTPKSQANDEMCSKLVLEETAEFNIEKNVIVLDVSVSKDECDIQSQVETGNPTEFNVEKLDMGILDASESNEENNIQSLEEKDPVKLDVDESDDSTPKSQANDETSSKFVLEETLEFNIEKNVVVLDVSESKDECDLQSQVETENPTESNVAKMDMGILDVSESNEENNIQSLEDKDPVKLDVDESDDSTPKSQANDKTSSKFVLEETAEFNIEKNVIVLDVSESKDEYDIQSQVETENPTESNVEKIDMGILDISESNEENNIQSLEDKDPVKLDVDESDESTPKSQANDETSSKFVLNETAEFSIEKNVIVLDVSESKDECDIQSQDKTENPTESNVEKIDMGILDVSESNGENDIQSLKHNTKSMLEKTVESNIERKVPINLDVAESEESTPQSQANDKMSSKLLLDNAVESNVESSDEIGEGQSIIYSQEKRNEMENIIESATSIASEFNKSTLQLRDNSDKTSSKLVLEKKIKSGDANTLEMFDSNDNSTLQPENDEYSLKIVLHKTVKSNIDGEGAIKLDVFESVKSKMKSEDIIGEDESQIKCDEISPKFELEKAVEFSNENVDAGASDESESKNSSTMQLYDNTDQKSSDFVSEDVSVTDNHADNYTNPKASAETDENKEIAGNEVQKECDESAAPIETERIIHKSNIARNSIENNTDGSENIIKPALRRGRRKVIVQDEPEPKQILQSKKTKITKSVSKLGESLLNDKKTFSNEEDTADNNSLQTERINEGNENKTVVKTRRGKKRVVKIAKTDEVRCITIRPTKDIEVSPKSKNIENVSVNELKEDVEICIKKIEAVHNTAEDKITKEKSNISATARRTDKNVVKEENKEPDQITRSQRGRKRKQIVETDMSDIPNSYQHIEILDKNLEKTGISKILTNVGSEHEKNDTEIISTFTKKRGKKRDIRKEKADEIIISGEQQISQNIDFEKPTTSKRSRIKNKDLQEERILTHEEKISIDKLTGEKGSDHDKQEREARKKRKLSTGENLEDEIVTGSKVIFKSTTKRGRRRADFQKDSGNDSIQQDKTDNPTNIECDSTQLTAKRKINEIEERVTATKKAEDSLNTNNEILPLKRSYRNKRAIDKDKGDVISKDAENEKLITILEDSKEKIKESVVKKHDKHKNKEHNTESENVDEKQTRLNEIPASEDSGLNEKEPIKTRTGRKASHNEDNIAKTSKTTKLNTSDVEDQRKRNVPRRAATAKNYDESSDIETNIKIFASENKSEVPTTSRGRTRKPIALVQEYLEKARAKTDSPKKILQLEESSTTKNQNGKRELKVTETADAPSNKRTRSAKILTDLDIKETGNEKEDQQKIASSNVPTEEVTPTSIENKSPIRKRGRKATTSKINIGKKSTAPLESKVVKDINEKTGQVVDKPDLKITRNQKEQQNITSLTLPTEEVPSTSKEPVVSTRKRGRKPNAAKIAETSTSPIKSDVIMDIPEKMDQAVDKPTSTRSKKVSFELEAEEAVKVKRTTTRTKKK